MFGCCICLQHPKQSSPEEVSFQKDPIDHYRLSIEPPPRSSSKASIKSLKPSNESQLEASTESSSQSPNTDPQRFSSSVCPLFFPTRDPLNAVSAQVSSQSANFDFILDLESDLDWEVKLEKSFAYVMVRTGSSQYPDLPMMKAFFDLEMDVDPELLYEVIYNPTIRRKWDQSIGDYKEIERLAEDSVQYYMWNKAPWPFTDRDFVENRYIRRRCNGDMEIFYRASVHEEYPDTNGKPIRGETIFGGQIFRKRISPNTGKMSLMITSICQANLKGEIPKKLLKVTLPSSILKWFRAVKKQVENSLKVSN